MCCDGTLFGRARLASGEEARIAAAGMEILDDADKTYFRLPCSFFGCDRCTIYEDRFEVCRTFTCALYRRQQANEVTPGEARAMVAKALQLRDTVTAAFPEAGIYRNRQALRARLAAELASAGADDRQATARALLDIIALDTFLENWFRNKKLQDQEGADPIAEPANS
jgi:Fe-S-cluster containining protein